MLEFEFGAQSQTVQLLSIPTGRFCVDATFQSSSYLTVWVGRRAGILPAAGCSSARHPPLKKGGKDWPVVDVTYSFEILRS
jgi:hypothetical protein